MEMVKTTKEHIDYLKTRLRAADIEELTEELIENPTASSASDLPSN